MDCPQGLPQGCFVQSAAIAGLGNADGPFHYFVACVDRGLGIIGGDPCGGSTKGRLVKVSPVGPTAPASGDRIQKGPALCQEAFFALLAQPPGGIAGKAFLGIAQVPQRHHIQYISGRSVCDLHHLSQQLRLQPFLGLIGCQSSHFHAVDMAVGIKGFQGRGIGAKPRISPKERHQ